MLSQQFGKVLPGDRLVEVVTLHLVAGMLAQKSILLLLSGGNMILGKGYFQVIYWLAYI
jgi:hypothetical protein